MKIFNFSSYEFLELTTFFYITLRDFLRLWYKSQVNCTMIGVCPHLQCTYMIMSPQLSLQGTDSKHAGEESVLWV